MPQRNAITVRGSCVGVAPAPRRWQPNRVLRGQAKRRSAEMDCRGARTMAGSAGFTLLTATFALLLFLALISPAQAVPAFARQTGQECVACHVSFPELTPYGRYFKLTGYTIGKPFVSSQGFNYMPM